MRTAVPADGTWVPSVRVPARILLDFGRHLPKEDPILLKVQGDHFVLGGHAIPCKRDRPELRVIWLPLNASPADILRVAAMCTHEEIEQSRLSRLVSRAQARRRRLVTRAGALLAPLGISADDLNQLIDKRLRELPVGALEGC